MHRMKHLAIILSILVCQSCLAQVTDTTDIFDVDKQYNLILKTEVEAKINRAIQPIIKKKLQEIRDRYRDDLEVLTEKKRQDEIQFIEDTIRINEFLWALTGYSMATTTIGMNWSESKRLDTYDKLLNSYYVKALSVLKPEMKSKLISSQKRWLDYYIKEKDFIYDLNDFGNHNSSLYNWGYYFEMLEKRVLFLKDVYNENFHGSETYKDQ